MTPLNLRICVSENTCVCLSLLVCHRRPFQSAEVEVSVYVLSYAWSYVK